ncbi:MAG: putative replicase [Cressdnaviricota sp.]|nr:MAG: putative replicase [Cressdnaviricota sp.]
MEKINQLINFLNKIKIWKLLKHIYDTIIYIIMSCQKKTIAQMEKQAWKRFNLKTKYEITCTFEDEWQGLKSTKCQNELQRLIHFNKFLACTYLPLIKHCKYELTTEISDPQVIERYKYPRLHLHGVIETLDDPEDLLIFKLNTLQNMGVFGRIQINKFRPEIWPQYCKKDQDLYSKWLKTYIDMPTMIKNGYEEPKEAPIDFFGMNKT